MGTSELLRKRILDVFMGLAVKNEDYDKNKLLTDIVEGTQQILLIIGEMKNEFPEDRIFQLQGREINEEYNKELFDIFRDLVKWHRKWLK